MSAIEVDVWADVVCPWCYIGKRRLEQALHEFEHPAEVTIRYHAFELDPTAPVGGDTPVIASLAVKYGKSLEEAREMAQHTAQAGRPDGIEIDVDRQLRANSFDAHRLVALGLAQGGPALQAATMERLYSAHFAEGKAVDDHEVLQRVAGEAGLDGRRVATVLAGEEFAASVRADEDAARQLGITGVPFAVANQHVAVSGAQSVETFGRLLRAALEQPSGAATDHGTHLHDTHQHDTHQHDTHQHDTQDAAAGRENGGTTWT